MIYVAVDIGAGAGTEVGFYNPSLSRMGGFHLGVDVYDHNFDTFCLTIQKQIEQHIPKGEKLASIGICSAGILNSDGSFQLFSNKSEYNGCNIAASMKDYFNLPVAIDNDANTGALAEWGILKMELLYWVFGGGWGGAWISTDGEIKFPVRGWDGSDKSLHYSNEPGYAIPLSKHRLKLLFLEVGASYELFEAYLLEDDSLPESIIVGPGGDSDSLRAEVILSGPGRCRLFRALVGDDTFYKRFLDIHEVKEMNDPSIAGKHISKLSNMRVETAINTDRLYGKILAEAAKLLISKSEKDGMKEGIPICLGGKPSYALPYFGPSCQRILGKMGLMNWLRPSVLDERGSNANLVGAALLAERAL